MELNGKKVLVFGAGKSGIGAGRLLLSAGAEPVIYDANEKTDPEAVCQKLGRTVRVITGAMPEGICSELDLVVMSPGVPCDIPAVQQFFEAGIPVWSEIELAYQTGKGRVLAVTGTNGKTTTVSLLGEIMKAYYPEVYVVGNIGTPYTDVSMQQTDAAVTVAECSSFQLETIREFHPVASAITNLTPDHLDRHHTMEEYVRCKERIAENQTASDVCVLNYEDPLLQEFAAKCPARVVWFSSRRPLEQGFYLEGDMIRMAAPEGVQDVVNIHDCQILGAHNYENIMAAAAMAYSCGVPLSSIADSIRAFKGVAHRIEYVAEIDGIRYYNDSKGTNPDAAIKAVRAMDRPTCLIGGGYDKGSDYEEWIRAFGGNVMFLALIGQTREKIAAQAVQCGFPKERIAFYEDLKQAIDGCREHAGNGYAVLLSPACASWGQFKNYEERGDLFREYVLSKKS